MPRKYHSTKQKIPCLKEDSNKKKNSPENRDAQANIRRITHFRCQTIYKTTP